MDSVLWHVFMLAGEGVKAGTVCRGTYSCWQVRGGRRGQWGGGDIGEGVGEVRGCILIIGGQVGSGRGDPPHPAKPLSLVHPPL